MKRIATCSCSQLKVYCTGEPQLVSLCHCIACQKRTGSAFGIAAFFERARVQIEGHHKSYQRSSDSGFSITLHFCPECGSTVFWEPERMPKLIAVGVGSFGDPAFPRPDQEVHVEHRHSWMAPLGD